MTSLARPSFSWLFSGSSSRDKSATGLRSNAPGVKSVDGRMLNGHLNEAELKTWAEGLEL